jgi:hypothetical protein
MSTGLFALNCPTCGDELEMNQAGAAACAGCGQAYLSRFGYLIRVDAPVVDTGSVDGET